MPTANRLSQMQYDEVSFVDKGAGEGVKVMLYKRDDGGIDVRLNDPASTDTDQVAKVGRTVSAANLTRLHEMHSTLGNFIDEHTPKEKKTMATKGKAAAADAEDQQDDGDDEDMEKRDNGATAEDIWKGVNPAIRKMFENMQSKSDSMAKRAEIAENLAKAEREARLNREFLTKAATFEALPGVTTDELGPVLRKLNDALDADTYTAVEGLLKRANDALASAETGLYREIGKSTSSGGAVPVVKSQAAAWAAIEKAASELISKDAKGLTMSQAIDKVFATRADLVHAYNEAE